MNVLRLSELGRQAANNASAGGIHIAPVYFKVGDSNAPHDSQRTDIAGSTLYQGDIHFVEVLSESSTRFAFYIPPHIPPVGGMVVREVAIYLEDNVMFARCAFDESYTLEYNEGTRVNAILTTTECDLSVIDVTIGDYASIPQTPYVRQLPSPAASEHNAISVLDVNTNPDGSSSPGLALRFGQGSFQWAFSAHDRVFTGNPDPGVTTNMFQRTSLTAGDMFADGERVIVHVAAGAGLGESRRFAYNKQNNQFTELDGSPFLSLDSSSVISIWKRMQGSGGSGCCCGGSGSGSSEGGTQETVTNYIQAKPAYAVGKYGVDTGDELETLLSAGSGLPDTNNTTFSINIVDDSGDGSTIPLRPIYGTDGFGITSTAQVDAWVAGSSSTEIGNTSNGSFTVNVTDANTYGYFLVPAELGDVILIDRETNLPGGWDGAAWPIGGIYDGSVSGPIDVARTIGGRTTNWKLYRMDFPGVGNKTFDYTLEFAGTAPSVSGTGGSPTNFGYFVYPVNLGLATFVDTDINVAGGWDGATWPNDGSVGSGTGPVTVSRNLGDGPSDWYVYRTDFPGIGNKTFSVTFENAGTVVNLPNGTTTVTTGDSSEYGDCCCSSYPNRSNVPEDWVLQRGAGNTVVWGPQKSGTEIVSTLYTAPGKLKITTLTDVGDGTQRRYNLGGVVLKDSNYMYTALGGIYQNRTAFDIQGSELEFAEEIPPNVSIDMRMFTKEPGNGTYIDFVTDTFVSNGIDKRFKLSVPVDGPEYVFVHVGPVLQQTVSYSYSPSTQEIVFTQSPSAGTVIETTAFNRRSEEGYSTEILTQQLITVASTLFIELPIDPQSKDATFLNVNGSHIHRDLYTVLDNKIILSSAIPAGRDVEVMIFNNVKAEGTPNTNLTGVVKDAVLTSKALKLLRHGAHPVNLPIPAVELQAGRGIKITGTHPNYKIESTVAEAFTDSTNFKFSTLNKEVNSDEIIYSYRVNISGDVLLTVIADFNAVLGPGFVSPAGRERMEYVIGFRTTSAREPEYGRQIKGTGVAGFSALDGGNDTQAYANASLTQVFEVIKDNIPAGYIDVVAKMRIKDAETSKYESLLFVNFNVIGTPKIVKTRG